MSGCAVKNKPAVEDNRYRKDTVNAWRLEIEQIEAKLVDIPLPIATLLEPKQVSFSAVDATAVMLTYQVKLSVEDLVRFYQQAMERAGWKQEMFFVGPQSLLVFGRPRRSCVISLSPGKQSTELMIVAGAKI